MIKRYMHNMMACFKLFDAFVFTIVFFFDYLYKLCSFLQLMV